MRMDTGRGHASHGYFLCALVRPHWRCSLGVFTGVVSLSTQHDGNLLMKLIDESNLIGGGHWVALLSTQRWQSIDELCTVDEPMWPVTGVGPAMVLHGGGW